MPFSMCLPIGFFPFKTLKNPFEEPAMSNPLLIIERLDDATALLTQPLMTVLLHSFWQVAKLLND